MRPGNAAGQEFDVNTRRVINRAEYWGSALYVEASGSFELVDEKAWQCAACESFFLADVATKTRASLARTHGGGGTPNKLHSFTFVWLPACVLLLQDVYLPVRVRARINSGSIGIAGASLALPIAGVGEFDVLWIDQALRVFKSGGAVAVQVQASHLRALGLL